MKSPLFNYVSSPPFNAVQVWSTSVCMRSLGFLGCFPPEDLKSLSLSSLIHKCFPGSAYDQEIKAPWFPPSFYRCHLIYEYVQKSKIFTLVVMMQIRHHPGSSFSPPSISVHFHMLPNTIHSLLQSIDLSGHRLGKVP